MKQLMVQLVRDEDGAEVMETSLTLAFIVLVTLCAMSALGIKVMDKWTKIGDML